MQAYRVHRLKYPDPLNTDGAAKAPGRWNSKGNRILYLADSTSLAMLEVRVHSPKPYPANRYLSTIDLPDKNIASLAELSLTLPTGWDTRPPGPPSQQFGDQWLVSKASLALAVPSVVAQLDSVILVNPNHPDFNKLKVTHKREISLDERLWT